ncbi:hypothetical protein [Pseudoalteromonas sp. S16_S37]|uniref:hypothetical protein n=1 Tax=Pseudoalteromonas sp. S16_S37 TaxID=2720228 RepID=UPI0016800069|nr:hypothetical protein [Pseudoalteromonas sp. S16_S37]MBD1584900.1 hypothetical protein [Pseudoalteromonas sp. S16_S37]
MTTPVTVYRWDDEDAPQINTGYGTANEIRAVLNACLVDGYGTKQPLGWTKVHDNINGVVYQNNTEIGSGGMVRFWPKGLDWEQPLYPNPMLFQSAKTYTDAETPFHAGNSQALKHPIYSSTNYTKAWTIIGTGYAFYLILGWVDETRSLSERKYTIESGTWYNFSMFCGDIHSRLEVDAGKFIAFCAPNRGDTTSTTWQETLDYITETIHSSSQSYHPKIYHADNSDGFRTYSPRKPLLTSNNELLNINDDIIGYSSVPLLSTSMSQILYPEDPVKPNLRGYMPGMIQTIMGLGQNHYWPTTKEIDGHQYWILRYAASDESGIWINMEQW